MLTLTCFIGFSMWNDKNECLSWDDTLVWFNLLGITPSKTLYRGLFDEKLIRGLWDSSEWDKCEGYIVRNTTKFTYRNFRNNVAKFVRKDHVQTVKHWMHGQAIIPNKLR